MRGFGSVVWGVLLASCAPSGTASLKLTATPRSVRPNGATTRVQIIGTLPSGRVGDGTVTARAAPGTPSEDVQLTLDAFGTATLDARCDAAADARCATSPQFSVFASWISQGKLVTGEVLIGLDPLPPGAEVVCNDGLDQDEDGMTDCADADCDAQACNDGEPCTTGERCAGSTCTGGGPTSCTTPPDPTCATSAGTCMPVVGCVYPATNVGFSCTDGNACTSSDRCTSNGTCVGTTNTCQNSINPCRETIGSCNSMTGQCEFDNRPNGTKCGSRESDRCCSGTCVDISASSSHCGGCGFVCATSQTCYDAASSCPAPSFDVSGRCGCATESDCPTGTDCVSNRCEPNSCKLGQGLEMGAGSCLDWCAY